MTSGPAPTATPTPTSIAGPGAAVVPTLSGWMLFLGVALAAAGLALMRRL